MAYNFFLKGNKENQFVEERKTFLDKFIKEICRLPYLAESVEFQTFLRPQSDVEKALENLPRMTTDEMLSRFRLVMPINEVRSINFPLKISDVN